MSKWKLRNGCPKELVISIKHTVSQVKENEPGTLFYSVHLDGHNPLATENTVVIPKSDTKEKQTQITFIEMYASKQAFSDHLQGPAFKRFLKDNLHYFYEDPKNPGWPITQTQYLDRISAFIRPQAG